MSASLDARESSNRTLAAAFSGEVDVEHAQKLFSEGPMPTKKEQTHLKNHPGDRGTPSERRCSERRSNHGRRHMDEVHVYGAEVVLTAYEACHYICISRPTLMKLITDGRIRAQRIGRGWRILRAEIDRFLRGG
jgi:excisionase family DNA binding protein